jgi:hypothetical protein
LVCQFELTAPGSAQQNGKVERKFATLYGRVQAMFNKEEFNWPLRYATWAYSSLHATKLDNLLTRPDARLSPYAMYHGIQQAWDQILHAFVEMSVVPSAARVQEKLQNKSFPAIYFGPA